MDCSDRINGLHTSFVFSRPVIFRLQNITIFSNESHITYIGLGFIMNLIPEMFEIPFFQRSTVSPHLLPVSTKTNYREGKYWSLPHTSS